MDQGATALPLLDLMIGVVIILAILFKSAFERLGLPALAGFIALGVLLRVADDTFGLISEDGMVVLEFLGRIGVFAILFRVGLESNLSGLLSKLPRAAPIWVSNIALSGLPAYWVSYQWIGLPLIPSLFVAIALTATSIAVTAEIWSEAGAISSANGELMMDVAELDDISAVALLAFLLALVPVLTGQSDGTISKALFDAGTTFLIKTFAFGAFCLLLARYGERHISRFIKSTKPPYGILFVAGIGIVVAALAAQLGLSLAVGALFAGLIFCRDPEVVSMEASFEPVHDFFMPFFFVVVGLSVDPMSLTSATLLGGILLIVAVLGKIIGAGVPAYFAAGWSGAVLIGISMVPRAEIALVVARQGKELGEWALPPEVYSALVLIVAVTCTVSPAVLRGLLRQWPQK
ncbi:MAG: cation:proton antiporter [Rhodospirillaceae bacterium]|nr:cation:proton antiporter [Rhodospirillaceae bacterium]